MLYRIDWLSFFVPFGISELLELYSLKMDFSLRTSSILSAENDPPNIVSASVSAGENATSWEKWRKEKDGRYTVIEPRIENQRLYFSKWSRPYLPKDPPPFADLTKKGQWIDASKRLPEGRWKWVSEWTPKVLENKSDSDGWVYAKSFAGWARKSPRKMALDTVRSRIVERKRVSSFKSENHTDFDEGVQPKGCGVSAKIQYGLKISLMKNNLKLDFKERVYYFLSDSNKEEYQFQDYSPGVFDAIRSLYGIEGTKYTECLCDQSLLGGAKNVAGKSGQIFWRTKNEEFVIKTVTHKEATFLQNNLESFFEHVKDNPHTLISRIFGLHKIKTRNSRLRFIVMNNVFSTCKQPPQLIYDLKGTTEDRLVKQNSKLKKQPILKDLNFINRYILVEESMRKAILKQIEKDVDFFFRLGIMDYSLLLGICVSKADYDNTETSVSENTKISLNTPRKRTLSSLGEKTFLSKQSVFENGIKGSLGETYYIGIIDVLQNWTKLKKSSNMIKTIAFFDIKQKKIDSVAPLKYGQRFKKYLQNKIIDANTIGLQLSEDSKKRRGREKRLLISCNSAKDLVMTEFGFSCNPYVLIQYGGRQSVTQIVYKNDNPVWMHFCSFPVPIQNPPFYVKFTVLSSELAFPPSVLGVAVLRVPYGMNEGLHAFRLRLLDEKVAERVMQPGTKRNLNAKKQGAKGTLDASLEFISFEESLPKENETLALPTEGTINEN